MERRKARVDEVLAEMGLAEIERETLVRVGNPFEEILAAIRELEIDLVVMGTRGSTKDGEYRILTGSVAEKVFRHSPVPVLSVRDE
jgi:nucleotide-binding universal stress UspA family protein